MDIQEKNNLFKDLMAIEDITDIGGMKAIDFTEEEGVIINKMLEFANNGENLVTLNNEDYSEEEINEFKSKLLGINPNIEVRYEKKFIVIEW